MTTLAKDLKVLVEEPARDQALDGTVKHIILKRFEKIATLPYYVGFQITRRIVIQDENKELVYFRVLQSELSRSLSVGTVLSRGHSEEYRCRNSK